jgi:hypothetical protein
MNRQGIAGAAIVIAAASGAVVAVATVADPPDPAYYEVQPLAFEFPSPGVFFTPGGPGPVIDHEEGGVPPFYDTITEKTPYTLYLDGTTDEIGHYTVARDYLFAGLLPFYQDNHQVVIDNDGAAADPAIGTVWDQSSAGLSFGISRINFFENFSLSDPAAGTTQDLFQIDFITGPVAGNYYADGPDGTVDVFNWFGTAIPIINTTGEPIAVAAPDLVGGDGLDTLWSEFLALG